jgi:hypothetical protein
MSSDLIPLLAIRNLLALLGRQFGNIIRDFIRQYEIENDIYKGNDGEPCLEDELDGVVEAG